MLKAPLALALLFSAQAFAACEVNDLQATYQITKTTLVKKSTATQLTLWRQSNRTAHQYPATNITEGWQLINQKMIKPTRYFDKYQRAIEYNPGESVHGKIERDWSYRHQLIADQMIDKATLLSKTGQGCDLVHSYKVATRQGEMTFNWLVNQRLLQSLAIKQGHYKERWELTQTSTDKATVSAFFDQLEDYQTTDFADVGDDHTDPFLTKMVTLGFIEHGASGFYDAQGNSLKGHGHSH